MKRADSRMIGSDTAPDRDGEEQTAVKSSSENCDAEAHDEPTKGQRIELCSLQKNNA